MTGVSGGLGRVHARDEGISQALHASSGVPNHRFEPEIECKWRQVDLDALSNEFHAEQKSYYLSTSHWTDTHPGQLMGSPTAFKKYDLNKVTLDELKVGLGAWV